MTRMAEVQPSPPVNMVTDQNRRVQLVDSVKKALFVIGSPLLIFIAFRNSVVWHLQQFWGASGNFWQNLWDSVYDLFGRNDLAVGVIGTILFTNGVIWGANALLLILDATGKPGFLLKYKVQEDKNVPVDRKKLKKAVKIVLFNGFVVSFPMTLFGFYLMKWRGCAISGEMPSFAWVLLELTVFSLVEEIGFYYSHRLMHHPRLYKHFHKLHHEWTAPIGIICIYAHPLEHCISNLMPIMMGPIIMGSHLATGWMWFFAALVSTTISHSGYHFPFLPSPEAHDFHHQKFTNCFGVLGVLDRLHGTDNNFRSSKAYERHIMLLSLTPLSQQYPDTPPKQCLEKTSDYKRD
ncbi:fatty acid hydroxylase domain-containing protein 2-like isoform X1 [Mytilus californianus]|uniref:fatty acid hydroxylase domain-containing protein 2-like isoform X1 n=2 Tax=Mytilus californianus TaxID=6549 RepID=UPI002245799A|nr:fatty acid hydroxylase domain-containing protein 2-like isoform X1 [Mytilus californianus]